MFSFSACAVRLMSFFREKLYGILNSNGKAFTDGSLTEGGKVIYAFILGYHTMGKEDMDQIVVKEHIHGYNAVSGNNKFILGQIGRHFCSSNKHKQNMQQV